MMMMMMMMMTMVMIKCLFDPQWALTLDVRDSASLSFLRTGTIY